MGGATHVGFAWYGRSNVGRNIQRTWVYNFWKVLNHIPHHTNREHTLSYLFRVINYIFFRNMSGKTLAIMSVLLS